MDVVPDEVAVRSLFDELTGGQPDVPPGRQRRIRRKALQHRVAKAAGTAAVIAAATALAVGIGTSAHRVAPDTGRLSIPAWALPWPDHRNGSVPQSVLNGAVLAWRHEVAPRHVPPPAGVPARVIWYVGQTVDRGEVVVVVFETESEAGKRLVAGWATASEVMNGQPGWSRGSSPWVLFDVAAPKPSRDLFIGLNVHGTSARQGRNPDNWIVVLAAPDVQGVGFTAARPSSTKTTDQGTTSSSTEMVRMVPAVRGLAVGDAGQITSPLQVTSLNVGNRNTLASPAYVGVPGSADSQVPQLARAARIHAAAGFKLANELTGQGMSGTELSGFSGRLAIAARCYGPGNLRLTFGTGAQERKLGTIPCDNASHEITTTVRLQPHGPGAGVIVYASDLSSYRVMLGTVR